MYLQALIEDEAFLEKGVTQTGLVVLYRDVQRPLSAQDYEQAATSLQKAVEAKSDSADLFNLLGTAHAMRGDIASAADGFMNALELDPSCSEAMQNLEKAWQVLQRDPGGLVAVRHAYQAASVLPYQYVEELIGFEL